MCQTARKHLHTGSAAVSRRSHSLRPPTLCRCFQSEVRTFTGLPPGVTAVRGRTALCPGLSPRTGRTDWRRPLSPGATTREPLYTQPDHHLTQPHIRSYPNGRAEVAPSKEDLGSGSGLQGLRPGRIWPLLRSTLVLAGHDVALASSCSSSMGEDSGDHGQGDGVLDDYCEERGAIASGGAGALVRIGWLRA